MSFDKVKAMRNAERYLSQGKINAAIVEYKQVIENDPRDFATMNILGDLCVKNSDSNEAVKYYTRVAEHYGNQGFAQKAIAIYNKVARIKPNSIEISSKLAELHKLKGSLAEARTHYTTVAEEYQKRGKKLEALDVWKSIAELDPNNTDIYLRIADVYRQENQTEEAAKAYTEAGSRLAALNKHDLALDAFKKAYELTPKNINLLNGLVKTQLTLGYSDEAVKILEPAFAEQPADKDLSYLLIDCYLDLERPLDAERIIHQLLEREPAEYPKLLELLDIYFKLNDVESATRILMITGEQLLSSGNSENMLRWLNEILVRNPEHLEGLRLLVRFHSWQRDEAELRSTLERLADAARLNDSIDDERYALNQLVMMLPNEIAFAERLHEINSQHGFVEVESIVTGEQVPESETPDDTAEVGSFAILRSSDDELPVDAESSSFTADGADDSSVSENGFRADSGLFDAPIAAPGNEDYADVDPFAEKSESGEEISLTDQRRIQQELESVDFYMAQGYRELAIKSLDALEKEFGQVESLSKYRKQLNGELPVEAADSEAMPSSSAVTSSATSASFDLMDDFRDELGFEENEIAAVDSDYDTHYQLAIAYKEMGLLEDAIKEFQDAINMSLPDDGTDRFFQCATLLGFCFMEKQMPNIALMWYRRAFETVNLTDDERQALQYEIACAYQAGGDEEKARKYFEDVYAVDVDYRDVSNRLQELQERVLQ